MFKCKLDDRGLEEIYASREVDHGRAAICYPEVE